MQSLSSKGCKSDQLRGSLRQHLPFLIIAFTTLRLFATCIIAVIVVYL
jgi:hypothetical protein